MRCKDLLGIDDARYARITAELRQQSHPSRGRDGPLCYNFDAPMVAILNHADPRTRTAFQVRPIDLSPRELHFLHGRSEQSGTAVVALLRDLKGGMRMVSGRIDSTRLVTGKVYVVSMRLHEEIEPTDFVPLGGLSEEMRREVSVWHRNWKSLIRIEDKELFSLMERLRAQEDRQEFRAKRCSPRQAYRQGAILVVLNPEDPTHWGAYRVPTMDLSAGGLGFLHGMFVHPGTRCDLLLTTVEGLTEILHGRVARCQIADGTVHQVGVRFDEPVDVARFLSDGEAAPGGRKASDAA